LDKVLCDALPEEGSPTERLARLAREILAFYWDKRSLLMLLYRDERMVRGRQGVLRERHDRLAARVQEVLLEGIERREYRGLDPHTAAELFLGMIRGINVFRRDGDALDEL